MDIFLICQNVTQVLLKLKKILKSLFASVAYGGFSSLKYLQYLYTFYGGGLFVLSWFLGLEHQSTHICKLPRGVMLLVEVHYVAHLSPLCTGSTSWVSPLSAMMRGQYCSLLHELGFGLL